MTLSDEIKNYFINLVEEGKTEIDTVSTHADIQEIIKKHEGWISIKDRQPTDGDHANEDVLVTDGIKVAVGRRDHYISYGYYSWLTDILFDEEKMTHWKPMPDPPKED